MQERIVIRRSIFGHILLFLGCAAFAVGGVFMLLREDNIILRITGIVLIALFGTGGLLCMLPVTWVPILIISPEGITIPFGRKKDLISWESIEKFEIIEQVIMGGTLWRQKQEYIGIFVSDNTGLMGAGKRAQAIAGTLLNRQELPGAMIHLNFSFLDIKDVLGTLQEAHAAYKGICGPSAP